VLSDDTGLSSDDSPVSPDDTYLFLGNTGAFLPFSLVKKNFLPRFQSFPGFTGMKNILNRRFAQRTPPDGN
jgi:hypothetical protein